jgi:drug/metabolite transporter (DMT)-like permease
MVIIMNALFLVITVISLTVQSVFKKAYLGKKSSVFLFNSLTGLAAAAVFFVFAKGKFDFCAEIFPYIISFAVCFIVCMFSSFMAIKTGSLALTSLVISYSLVIPTLYGIIFRKDPTILLFYIGISLLILSLFLVNFEKGEQKITKKWLWFVVPCMVAVYIFRAPIFNVLFTLLWQEYDATDVTGAVTILILLIMFGFYSYILPADQDLDKDTIALRNILLLSIVIQIFAMLHPLSMRMNYYFLIFIPIAIPKIVLAAKDNNIQLTKLSVVVMNLVFTAWFFYNAYFGADMLQLYPYVPYWS